MSTSNLYHAHGIKGVEYKSTSYEKGCIGSTALKWSIRRSAVLNAEVKTLILKVKKLVAFE